jgi:hypothetical protein
MMQLQNGSGRRKDQHARAPSSAAPAVMAAGAAALPVAEASAAPASGARPPSAPDSASARDRHVTRNCGGGRGTRGVYRVSVSGGSVQV